MSDPVHDWIDEPGLLEMLTTHELDSWQVSDGRVIVALYRASDRTVTHRSLSGVEVPPRPDPAAILRGGVSERALCEVLAAKRPRCALEQATSSGPMRPSVHCGPKDVRLAIHTDAEWQQEVAWHTWRAFQRRLNITAPRDGGPTPPRPPRAFRALSWAAARTALEDAAREQQLTLPDALA
jgi:hypothetical protein